ncbi:carbohydrate ABC transporter permease [Lacrimispora sp.]|uniref:carbohydrate ABC transporter permease n=1 Tax=Lacrimispora sp. TaxID=2719234 RepID=UPI0028AA636A|nr:carbohydrate ABC transporter permease [Lacrimispora sp.]
MKAERKKKKKSIQDMVLDAAIVVVMVLVVFSCLYPFLLAVIMSFNEGIDALKGGIYFWPRKLTFENYNSLFKDPVWGKAFLVTFGRTVIGTTLTVLFTLFVSYGLSHKDLVFRKFYFSFFIFAMYFSGGVIPYYILLRSLHLLNKFWVYVVPGCLSLFYILVATSFFQGIPEEIAESAKLDGAGELKIYRSLILPLSKPIMATIAIFTSVGHWNNWYDSAFFATSNKGIRTMAYLMTAIINQSSSQNTAADAAMAAGVRTTTILSIQLAAMVIAVLPILCVYPFFQRYFVTGLTVGAVKS